MAEGPVLITSFALCAFDLCTCGLFANKGPRECTVWMAAHHSDKRALEILAREIAPAGTGMGLFLQLFPFLILRAWLLPCLKGPPKVFD